MTRPDPAILAEIRAAAIARLLIPLEAVQRVTWGMNLDRPATIPATGAAK